MVDKADTDKPDSEECAWCKFMKGGPCKAAFEVWQSCIDSVMESPEEAADEESRQAAVVKCAGVTAPLFECLVKHPDYYGPQIDSMAERSRAEQVDLDVSAAAAGASHSSGEAAGSRDRSSTTTGSMAAAAAAASVVEPAGRTHMRGS
eukprot:GHUV01006751.1.p1 GENE.GHUV01006751.1~~GHUV01006751.1.p1  ORF type:complete len:148 (+),score=72.35 GHUV01006751.1:543-986(+)